MDRLIRKLVLPGKTNCPFSIAKRIGVNVWFDDLGSSTRGFYFRKLRRRYIGINQDLDEAWARFVCAHELGHDRLHPGMSRFFLDDQTLFNAGKYERQANRFAVLLLTYNSQPELGESIESFLIRNSVPREMHTYYKNN